MGVGLLLALGALAAGLPAVLQAERGERPGAGRAGLSLPAELWGELLDGIGRPGETLGYSFEQMSAYGRDLHRLRPVEILFRDVAAIPRFGGTTAMEFLGAAGKPGEVVRQAFLLTDVSAGRLLPMPVDSLAGSDWQPDGVAWDPIPEPVQRLVARVLAGMRDALPWLRAAYASASPGQGEGSSTSEAPASEFDGDAIDSLYALARAPWVDERLGQLATTSRGSFEVIGRIDREYLALGSIVLLTHVSAALDEYRAAADTAGASAAVSGADAAGCRLATPLGVVQILGAGADAVTEPAILTVDLGGDDRYEGRHAVPLTLRTPLALVIDLDGNDAYVGGDVAVAMACGLFGVGAIFDLAGDDSYQVLESGLGAGWYGCGVLVDFAGNDRYVVDDVWGQGAAHVGAGVLIDLDGDDFYTCGSESQGLGSTLAAGVLLDVAGDDRYLARDDGNPSPLYNNQSVSMAQGVGYGRRADLGDGHSLAGGFGVLVDGAGDDTYHASAWSQGAGYWWAAGLLEDLGGNDSYRNGKYSLGAAAHFAVGCQVDLSGDDRYNVGNESAVNQFQGHARDGSIGVSIDGDGRDEYFLKSHCAGSGDLASIGLFWDRRGDDRYTVAYEPPDVAPGGSGTPGWSDTPPMGSATLYTPFHSFRDDLDAVGFFLDSGGRDEYAWKDGPAEDGGEWKSIRGPRSLGLGLDVEWFKRRNGE
jgi:hypothetical protein